MTDKTTDNSHITTTAQSEAALLSRMLFEAREQAEMFADLIERQTGGGGMTQARRLVREIDAYRAARGWSPDGFGGER
ncbi:hypothetical protein ACIODS_11825 [Micromonospora chalcea]|uniref:hypothetical protein n=1 Tax=Micromonospora chalcea TaxID=1874 RepID=UPI00380C03A0